MTAIAAYVGHKRRKEFGKVAGFCHLPDNTVFIMFILVTNLELGNLLEAASELLLRFTGHVKYILAC